MSRRGDGFRACPELGVSVRRFVCRSGHVRPAEKDPGTRAGGRSHPWGCPQSSALDVRSHSRDSAVAEAVSQMLLVLQQNMGANKQEESAGYRP